MRTKVIKRIRGAYEYTFDLACGDCGDDDPSVEKHRMVASGLRWMCDTCAAERTIAKAPLAGTNERETTMRPWPTAIRSDEMTDASEHVFQDAGAWWFETEDESSIGPFPTVDAADDAFKAYCADVLGHVRPASKPA